MRTSFVTRGTRPLAALVVIALLAGCEPGPTPSPGATASGFPGPSTSVQPTPSTAAVPTPTPAGTPLPTDPPSQPGSPALMPGMLAVTVSDGLRVRSEPRVADDSLKYTPLLETGTELVVSAGPVHGSGFDWYRVA